MSRWLLKTEPAEWSWGHQSKNGGRSKWDGVRNAQALKSMRNMRVGDECFFYHSGKAAREIVGIVRVCRDFYGEPKCGAVDVEEVRAFDRPVSLVELKAEPAISGFAIFKQPRLSVVPVSEDIWNRICSMAATVPDVDEEEERSPPSKKRKRCFKNPNDEP